MFLCIETMKNIVIISVKTLKEKIFAPTGFYFNPEPSGIVASALTTELTCQPVILFRVLQAIVENPISFSSITVI